MRRTGGLHAVPITSQAIPPIDACATLRGRDLLSIRDLTRRELLSLFALATDVKRQPSRYSRGLSGKTLALIFEMREVKGRLEGLGLAFVGDGNNVANSLIFAAALLGVRMTIASPSGYEPRADVLGWARRHARAARDACRVTSSPEDAFAGADVVYTDTWISMGQEGEAEERRRAFTGFQVTSGLLDLAPDAVFMHCLPAHRGEEVAADVIDSPRSIVCRQAENRVHTEKALLLALLGNGD